MRKTESKTKDQDESQESKKSLIPQRSSHHFITAFKERIPPAIPLEKPHVDPELPYLPTIERSSETIHYSLKSLEYSISPKGKLRQWIKLNLILFLWICIPVIFFIPLITYCFSQFASITGYFNECTFNLLHSLPPLLIVVIVLAVILAILRR